MPIAIEVTFGTGRYVAVDVADRTKPEWPPHPARLFSALVEAWARYGSAPPDPGERAALEWLERQPPPTIFEPGGSHRRAVGLFVPVNNATAPKSVDRERGVTKWWTLLPEERKRTPRHSMPSTLVEGGGRVVFAWPDSDPSTNDRQALAGMAGRVTRLGHSSSFVACRLVDDPPDPVWVPRDGSAGSEFSLRAMHAGMLEALVARHESYLDTGLRNSPIPSSTAFYAHARSPVPDSTPSAPDADGEWILFELERSSRQVSSTKAAPLAKALRGAIISHCPGTAPRLLVGKDADGQPTSWPHALFLSLPFVGHHYADGAVKGLVMLLPNDSDEVERKQVLRAVGAWRAASGDGPLDLRLSSRTALRLRLVPGFEGSDTAALDRLRWSRTSRRWASVTALALPRDAYRLTHGSPSDMRRAWRRAEEAVVDACRFAGLPDPAAVSVGFDPPVRGGSHTSDYPAFVQSGKKRLLLHAVVEFEQPVAGPVVLGSGRFRGLGLMLPVASASGSGVIDAS